MDEVINEKNVISRRQSVLISKNNDQIPIEYASNPIWGDDGELLGATIIFDEITSLLKEETVFNEQLNIYSQLPLAIGMTDSDGNILDVNQASMDLFELTDKSDLKNMNLFNDFKLDSEDQLINIEQIANKNGSEKNTHELGKLAKSDRLYQTIVSTIEDNGEDSETRCLFYLQDVTNQQMMEESIKTGKKDYNELLNNNESLKSQITGLITEKDNLKETVHRLEVEIC